MLFNPFDPIGSLKTVIIESALELYKTVCGFILSSGGPAGRQWEMATDTINKIAGVMGFVAVACGAAGVVYAMFKGKPGEVFMALGRTLLAWPLTVVFATVMMRAFAVVNKLPTKILAFDPNDIKLDGSFNNVSIWSSIVIGLITIISALVLWISVFVQNFLLIFGISLLPCATMVGGWKSLQSCLTKWVKFYAGVILFKPVCALMVYITVKMVQAAAEQKDLGAVPMFLTAAVGMALAGIMPWKITSIISSFMPLGAETARAANVAGSAVSAAGNAVLTAGSLAAGAYTGFAGIGFGGGAAGSSGMPSTSPKNPNDGSGSAASSMKKAGNFMKKAGDTMAQGPSTKMSGVLGGLLRTGGMVFSAADEKRQSEQKNGQTETGKNPGENNADDKNKIPSSPLMPSPGSEDADSIDIKTHPTGSVDADVDVDVSGLTAETDSADTSVIEPVETSGADGSNGIDGMNGTAGSSGLNGQNGMNGSAAPEASPAAAPESAPATTNEAADMPVAQPWTPSDQQQWDDGGAPEF